MARNTLKTFALISIYICIHSVANASDSISVHANCYPNQFDRSEFHYLLTIELPNGTIADPTQAKTILFMQFNACDHPSTVALAFADRSNRTNVIYVPLPTQNNAWPRLLALSIGEQIRTLSQPQPDTHSTVSSAPLPLAEAPIQTHSIQPHHQQFTLKLASTLGPTLRQSSASTKPLWGGTFSLDIASVNIITLGGYASIYYNQDSSSIGSIEHILPVGGVFAHASHPSLPAVQFGPRIDSGPMFLSTTLTSATKQTSETMPVISVFLDTRWKIPLFSNSLSLDAQAGIGWALMGYTAMANGSQVNSYRDLLFDLRMGIQF